MMFFRFTILMALFSGASSFMSPIPSAQTQLCRLQGKSSEDDTEVVQATAFALGTIVEFTEKSREHVGKIINVERKSNGKVRYDVEEFPTSKTFNVADKEVQFALPAPTNDKQVEKILQQLEKAHEVSEIELRRDLDISPELLEMAWEESAEEAEEDNKVMTPAHLIELVHSHKASPLEKYEAWRLLKSEAGHVYFREIKENGRVVAFKPKPKNSVEASKENFSSSSDDEEFEKFCLSGLKP